MSAPPDILTLAEDYRVAALAALDEQHRASRGQFFTPLAAARLLVTKVSIVPTERVRLLDPGAGTGMLTAALIERLLREHPGTGIEVVAIEQDERLVGPLESTLLACKEAAMKVGSEFDMCLLNDDALELLLPGGRLHPGVGKHGSFDFAVLNPPYAKLSASSPVQAKLKTVRAECPNLYAAFVVGAVMGLAPGGQVSAITPRSFTNGPYFTKFRRFLLANVNLDEVHVFTSRSKVFSDSGVLQENVIFAGTKNSLGSSSEGHMLVSESDNDSDEPRTTKLARASVVQPSDPEQFIRLVGGEEDLATAESMARLPRAYAESGFEVSTGRVVDFRCRAALLDEPSAGSVPLIYPGNISNGAVSWPRAIRKPQALRLDDSTARLVLPNGWYVLVKRFSSKEERRRIVAGVWSPALTGGPVAFENHLNVFHSGGEGLTEFQALGLATWLNSSLVDSFFRTFSGHTQVNATDLRSLRYPDAAQLESLGTHVRTLGFLEQATLDALVAAEVPEPDGVAA